MCYIRMLYKDNDRDRARLPADMLARLGAAPTLGATASLGAEDAGEGLVVDAFALGTRAGGAEATGASARRTDAPVASAPPARVPKAKASTTKPSPASSAPKLAAAPKVGAAPKRASISAGKRARSRSLSL